MNPAHVGLIVNYINPDTILPVIDYMKALRHQLLCGKT